MDQNDEEKSVAFGIRRKNAKNDRKSHNNLTHGATAIAQAATEAKKLEKRKLSITFEMERYKSIF